MKQNSFVTGKQTYRADIDGLKGLAILLVFVFHYASVLVPGGFVGVDVFFVVSGYLIGRSVYQSVEAKKFKLSTYFANRAKRIFPSLIVMLAALWAFGWFAFLPKEFASLGKHIGGASVFISNWMLWREVGYFDTSADLKPLLNLWSLGVEEQFYLLFPFIVFLALRLKRQLLLILGIIFLATLVASEMNIKDMRAWAYFHPLSRFWELLAGGILAYAELRPWYTRTCRANLINQLKQGCSLGGIGLLMFAAFGYSKSTVFPGAHALLPVMGATLIIAAGPTSLVNRWILSNKCIVYVGLISYPLYLWHWPLISVVRVIDGMEPSAGIKAVLALLTIALSVVSYQWLEKPIRFGRFNKRRLTPIVLWGVLLMLGALGYTTFKKDGYPERFENNVPEQIVEPLSEEKGQVVLVGDSNGLMYESALRSAYGKNGYGLIANSRGGCMPLWNLERHDPGYMPDGCSGSINKGYAEALNNSDVREVIVIGSFAGLGNIYDISKPEEDAVAQGRVHSDATKWAIFERQLDATVKMFEGKGKKLIFFYTTPNLDFDPIACENRPLRLISSLKQDCAISKSKVLETQRQYRAVFERIKSRYGFTEFFDPAEVLCNENICIAAKDGVVLYEDPSHLNAAGANLVLKAYSP